MEVPLYYPAIRYLRAYPAVKELFLPQFLFWLLAGPRQGPLGLVPLEQKSLQRESTDLCPVCSDQLGNFPRSNLRTHQRGN